MGMADDTVRFCRNRSVAQNSTGISEATSACGQLFHMTMKPDPANTTAPSTAGTRSVPRRRQNR